MSELLRSSLTSRPFEMLYSHVQRKILERLFQRMQEVGETRASRGSASSGSAQAVAASTFDHLIEQAAERHQVDADLVRAVIKVESNFDPGAVSHAGAKGLMQLMDATAESLGVGNSFDAAENIDGGVRYLAQQLHRFHGNLEMALAAYNAGPGTVMRHRGIPPIAETQTYVQQVFSYYPAAGSRLDYSA